MLKKALKVSVFALVFVHAAQALGSTDIACVSSHLEPKTAQANHDCCPGAKNRFSLAKASVLPCAHCFASDSIPTEFLKSPLPIKAVMTTALMVHIPRLNVNHYPKLSRVAAKLPTPDLEIKLRRILV